MCIILIFVVALIFDHAHFKIRVFVSLELENVRHLDSLESAKSLTSLDVSMNRIDVACGFECFVRLRVLCLAENRMCVFKCVYVCLVLMELQCFVPLPPPPFMGGMELPEKI